MLALGTRVTVQLGEGDDGAVTEGGEAGVEDGDGSGKRWRATVLEYSTDSETCTLEVDGLGVLDEVSAAGMTFDALNHLSQLKFSR